MKDKTKSHLRKPKTKQQVDRVREIMREKSYVPQYQREQKEFLENIKDIEDNGSARK